MTTISSYRLISQNLERSLEQTARQPTVQLESEYYMKNIGKVTSADEFVDDTRLFNYAMRAHGLSDMSYAKAFMKKVLVEGIDNQQSFANSLADPRYREFAETFNFDRYGDTAVVFDRAQQGTVDKYVRQTLEEDSGAENEGVRLALYFQRKAPEVSSAFGLLADRALLKVTQVALGLSEQTSSLPLDDQAALIQDRLDVEDLKDPEKLDELLNRFAAIWEIESPSTSVSTSVPSLILSGPSVVTIGDGLLASLQKLRIGG
ncbi:MAG: DUF1217 domain-containing protein [Pseudomonadota bacterium]